MQQKLGQLQSVQWLCNGRLSLNCKPKKALAYNSKIQIKKSAPAYIPTLLRPYNSCQPLR